MKLDVTKLVEPTRDDLLRAIRHTMLYCRGVKRRHDFDSVNAQIAAEVLIDGLAASNYLIMRGPPGQPVTASQTLAEDVKVAEANW